MPHEHIESPLLRLPRELRNRIYFYVFTGEQFQMERQGFNTLMFPYIDRRQKTISQLYCLGLLSVCRQIHAEAALSSFTIGTIVIDNIETLEELQYRLTAAQRSAIRTLRLVTPLGGNANIVRLFVSKSRKRELWLRNYLPGVRKVVIEVVKGYTDLQQRQGVATGMSLLQRMRLHKRRDQTERWLTGGGGSEIEVTFCGYGMCEYEASCGHQRRENLCSCC